MIKQYSISDLESKTTSQLTRIFKRRLGIQRFRKLSVDAYARTGHHLNKQMLINAIYENQEHFELEPFPEIKMKKMSKKEKKERKVYDEWYVAPAIGSGQHIPSFKRIKQQYRLIDQL